MDLCESVSLSEVQLYQKQVIEPIEKSGKSLIAGDLTAKPVLTPFFDLKQSSFRAIWENEILEPVSKLILLSLARRHSSTQSSPSQEEQEKQKERKKKGSQKTDLTLKTLCEETNSSYQTVTTHLRKLRDLGYVLIKEFSHKKRVYQITEKLFLDYENTLRSQGFSPDEAKMQSFESGESPKVLQIIKGISSSQKIILLWLSSQSQKSQFLAPQQHHQEEMGRQIGLSKNALTRAVQKLEEKGHLHIIRSLRRANVYSLSESLFYPPSFQDPKGSNNESKNEAFHRAGGSKDPESQNPSSKNETLEPKKYPLRLGSLEHHCCYCESRKAKQEEDAAHAQNPSLQDPSLQNQLPVLQNPVFLKAQILEVLENLGTKEFLYPESLPLPEEGKKPENEAFGIAKLLLGFGRETPLCTLTVQELSKSIIEQFGLRILKQTKKLCFEYNYLGMDFHKLHWLCKEVFEHKNPFELPVMESAQKELKERRLAAEKQKQEISYVVQKNYIEDQYRQKQEEEKDIAFIAHNPNVPLSVAPHYESPLDAFRKTFFRICLNVYHGPESKLRDFVEALPLPQLKIFKSESEKMSREGFEEVMKRLVLKQFGTAFQRTV